MKTLFITLVLFGTWCRGVAEAPPQATDLANLQGVWLAQSESQNGNKRDVRYEYVFSGNKLIFKDETGKEMKYRFKLETAGSLKLITIQPEETEANAPPVSVHTSWTGIR